MTSISSFVCQSAVRQRAAATSTLQSSPTTLLHFTLIHPINMFPFPICWYNTETTVKPAAAHGADWLKITQLTHNLHWHIKQLSVICSQGCLKLQIQQLLYIENIHSVRLMLLRGLLHEITKERTTYFHLYAAKCAGLFFRPLWYRHYHLNSI